MLEDRYGRRDGEKKKRERSEYMFVLSLYFSNPTNDRVKIMVLRREEVEYAKENLRTEPSSGARK